MTPADLAAVGLRLDIEGPVATVTLDRPDVRNAQTPAMWLALAEIGLPVSRLTRTAVGPIELRAMRSGTIRKLSRQELGALSELVGL